MSEYQEFTGKTVEEALRNARESFGVQSLDDLDFEILTPGSRGVLGMGAEPARIVAAPRSALGGAAPRREAAAATPLPPPPPREPRDRDRDRDRGRGFGRDRDRGDRGPRDRDRGGRGGRYERGPVPAGEPSPAEPEGVTLPAARYPSRSGDRPERGPRPERRPDRGGRPDRGERPDRSETGSSSLSEAEQAEVSAARGPLSTEREEVQAVEASPEALEAGREILETLMRHMGYQDVTVQVVTGETSKLDVRGSEAEREALGALIGRKGERLSALQHLVNLLLSRRMGDWTRVLVDVEDYRGRRERQLHEIALRAAEHVESTGKMLQLEPMPALERRWIHLALRNHPAVATQSIGEEPNRRVVVLRREG
jgi:spoIIIJ-associated protein